MERNAPCLCGSGKKYKKCCMLKEQTNYVHPQMNYVEVLDRGIAYKRMGNYSASRECYIEAIKISPKRPLAYYNLGKVLYIQEEYESALKSYKTALELGYDKTDTMRHIGHALLDPQVSSEEQFIVNTYRKMIDPAYSLSGQRATEQQLSQYELKCVEAAIHYLETFIG